MAVVGRNGSGKTTMIKLLCRLYEPTEGAIYLNGIDIKKYDYCEYMQSVSYTHLDVYKRQVKRVAYRKRYKTLY